MLQSPVLLEAREQIPPLRGTLQQKQIEGWVISLEKTGENNVNCLKKKGERMFYPVAGLQGVWGRDGVYSGFPGAQGHCGRAAGTALRGHSAPGGRALPWGRGTLGIPASQRSPCCGCRHTASDLGHPSRLAKVPPVPGAMIGARIVPHRILS